MLPLPKDDPSSDSDPDIMEHILDSSFGELPPGSSPSKFWKDPPVGYVPAGLPTGPRDLRFGRWVCPFEGCDRPVGPTEDGEGYDRTSLAAHVIVHGGEKGLYELRRTVRKRVFALRYHLGRATDDIECMWYYKGGALDDLQAKTDDMIMDLNEIRNWEQSSRSVQDYKKWIKTEYRRPAANGSCSYSQPQKNTKEPAYGWIKPQSSNTFYRDVYQLQPLDDRQTERIRPMEWGYDLFSIAPEIDESGPPRIPSLDSCSFFFGSSEEDEDYNQIQPRKRTRMSQEDEEHDQIQPRKRTRMSQPETGDLNDLRREHSRQGMTAL
ncbi:hypothetical protein diail_2794 [Diaporthe ilicicola]|nr:hypothetical protein diail_2794 [Diaporthe ilicicola]